MDVFNRPPTISEDTLQYALYPPPSSADKPSVTSFAACISAWVDLQLPDFLWHRDAFELKVVVSRSNSDEFFLEGRMRVGDCVDDEWCAVWLLKQISSQWDMAISVFDSDGEFLLIEAADSLPNWITPTNSENRVWIYCSQLHIIPLLHVSPPSRKRQHRKLPGKADSDDEDQDDQDFLAVEDALVVLRDASLDTLAPPAVQKDVWARTNGYPAAAKNHVHATKAYVPLDIARALASNPSLVQKPVETFYTRDAIQLRAAHRMTRFPPDSTILRTVKMSRTAYAQLLGQKFFPPKVFGQWKANEGTDEWRWRDVGMKIAVGFEMLYQESKGRTDSSTNSLDALQSSVQAKKDALRRTPLYTKYIQNLQSVDYFRGEIEGSQLWTALEDKAAETFLATQREDDATRPSFASLVSAAVTKTPTEALSTLDNVYEDSDQWLNVDAKDFENMLETTMGSSKREADAMEIDETETEGQAAAEEHMASEQAARLKNLATKVEAFVEGKGDLEGAIFDDEEMSDDDDEDFSDEPVTESETEEEEEDPAARKAAMDKLVPGIEPSEYGQMPASFHENSQKVAPSTVETDVVEDVPAPKSTPTTNTEPHTRPIRQPIIPRDRYDGVDSDDETDEEEEEDEEEDERPQVVGDIEVDMGEEEDEFLEFSRQALGISDAQWGEILRDRQSRGAFVPPGLTVPPAPKEHTSTPKQGVSGNSTQGRPPEPGPRPNVNPNLDSFEAVMLAMDKELAQSRQPASKPASAKSAPRPPKQDKGKGKATVESIPEEVDDIDAAMEIELRAALEREDDDEDADEAPMDYNLIKNFLESFKSQGGLSGPVSTLAGRLESGWQLPRDS